MVNTVKVISDFNTTLNLKVAVWATSATLDSATDDNGVALPTGTYILTFDGTNAPIESKEYIICTLTGTALTAISSYSCQWVVTSWFLKTHRKWATVTLTDWGALKKLMDLADGTVSNSEMTFVDLTFTGTTTSGLKVKSLTTTQRDASSNAANWQIIYNSTTGELNVYQWGAWSAIASGSTQADASTTVAGKVEIATSAETIAWTDTGGTGAKLVALPSDQAKNIQSGTFTFGADAGGDDTYVVAVTPTLTALTTGMFVNFSATTANTGACTLDAWFGGALAIKTLWGNDPTSGDVVVGLNRVQYNGTNWTLQNTMATTAEKGVVEMCTDAEATAWTDEVRYINSKQAKITYASGTTTKNAADASWTQNIAHGLGVAPKYVRIRALCDISDGSGDRHSREANTVYNGTTQSSLSYYQTGAQTTSIATTFTLNIDTAGGTQTGVVTVDSTNIIITWTKTNSPAGTYTLLWEANS